MTPWSGSRSTVRLLTAIILFATLGAADPAGQRQASRGGGSGSTSRPLSSTVLASWSMHWSNADGSTMTLLVLWRGSPGWFARGPSGGGSGGGGGSSASNGSSGRYSYQWLSQGGLTFSIEFDFDRKIVKLLDREFDLTQSNVVLVDHVDASGGPTIAGTRWVEPASDATPAADAIEATIKGSPELFDYLQCHVPPPPPPAPIPPEAQAMVTSMIAAMCERMRP